jgi:hypothetical protein
LQTYFLFISNFSHERAKDLLVSTTPKLKSIKAWDCRPVMEFLTQVRA